MSKFFGVNTIIPSFVVSVLACVASAHQDHSLIYTRKHSTTYCKAAVSDLSSSQKQMSEKTTKSSNSQKRRHQVAHSVSCQLEYSGECLSPFTYKCHLLSSQGLGKVLLSPL